MSKFKYIGNKDLYDGTVVIIIDEENGISVGIGGEVELTENQYNFYSQRFWFEEIKSTKSSSKQKTTVAPATDKA